MVDATIVYVGVFVSFARGFVEDEFSMAKNAFRISNLKDYFDFDFEKDSEILEDVEELVTFSSSYISKSTVIIFSKGPIPFH